jgi:tetratricopeptide (TPR) repeat protein
MFGRPVDEDVAPLEVELFHDVADGAEHDVDLGGGGVRGTKTGRRWIFAAVGALAVAADAQAAAGNTEQANNLLVRLLASDPTNTSLAAKVVDALAASKKYDVAKEIVTKAVADNPGDIGLIRLQFLILTSAGDYKPAIKIGEEMVTMDTSLADTTFFTRLAALYAADSQPQKSAEAAARATQKFPNHAGLWQLYAQTLRGAGQTQQSIAAAKRALEIDPKLTNGWTQIAVAYNELQMPDSALDALRQAAAAGDDKDQVGGYALNIGNTFFKAAQAEEPKQAVSYQRALPFLHFADSTVVAVETKTNAKLLIGVSSYFIAATVAQTLQASKSCDDARLVEKSATDAVIFTQQGGRASPETATQILPAANQLLPYAQAQVKNLCK